MDIMFTSNVGIWVDAIAGPGSNRIVPKTLVKVIYDPWVSMGIILYIVVQLIGCSGKLSRGHAGDMSVTI